MTSYRDLSILDKARLLDQLVLHAENIDNNFMVVLNSESDYVKESVKNAKAFLRVINVELSKPGKWGNKK